MRSRSGEFGIFPRRSRKTIFYYYWVYDNDGKRKFRSTGKKDYDEALRYCRSLQIKGQLSLGTSYSFNIFTKDFFDYDTCPYIANRLLRGFTYGKTWAIRQRSLLKKIIQPHFNDADIRNISAKNIDDFILHLRRTEIGAKTLNHILTAIKAIFGYAAKTGVIEPNPAEGIKPFKITSPEKGIFSKAELIALFNEPDKFKIWKHPKHYLLNYIAATTGLRLGEILALRPENVTEKTIRVEYSWNRIEGLKDTKTGKTRIVPISMELGNVLWGYITNNNITGFIFSANKGKTPMDYKAVYKHFRYALSKIGLNNEVCKKRNITFHSYRHTFNTLLLEAGVHPETVRLMTGHSANMTARYSHMQLNNMPDVMEKISVIVPCKELACSNNN